MKYRIMKLINNLKDFFINMKNLFKKFVIENKKTSIIIAIILFVIIIGIFIIANTKSEIGNTSGNLNNSGFSVEKDGWVYYVGLKNSNTDGIYKIKSKSGSKEKVTSDYGLYLNKSGKFLYYLEVKEGKYNIVKIENNGENKEIVIENVDTAKITVVDNWIYYFKDFNFYRTKTNGKEKQILSKKSIDNYEVNGDWIYYSYINDGKYAIAKMRKNGENVTKIDNDLSNVFFVYGNDIYYIYESYNEESLEHSYELFKVKSNGEKKEKVANLGKNVQLENINFDGEKMYYLKTNENNVLSIYSIKLNGKDENKIVDIQGFSTMLNINDGWIYYTDQNENGDSQMFRIKTEGKEKQSL